MSGRAENPAARTVPTSDNEATARGVNSASDKWSKMVTTSSTTYVLSASADRGEIERVYRGLAAFTSRTDL